MTTFPLRIVRHREAAPAAAAQYTLAPGVRWAVEHTTLLVTGGQGTVRTLAYPEAAIWDLLARGYSPAKVVEMMTHIARVDASRARVLVTSALETWIDCGLLTRG